jgi:hypothetical protein
VFLSLLLVTLPGCGPKRMRADFVGFEAAYAETSNREVLLNLARLQKHDPTYFFKIGQISSLYRMQASVTGNGSYAVQTTNPLVGGPTGGGSPLLNYENDPSFTFIPVNDQTNAQYLLQPIPAETFYALYQEGWRVDQLFRLMVDRIELTVPNPSRGGCDVETFRNAPPQVFSKPGEDLKVDADALSRYVVFLRISAILYALQKHGDLILSGTSTFVPYDDKSALREDAAYKPPSKKSPTVEDAGPLKGEDAAREHESLDADDGSGGGGTNAKSRTPAASDIINAIDKGAVWEKSNGKWLLGQKIPNAVFYLNHYRLSDPNSPLTPAKTPVCDITNSDDSDSSDTCKIAHDILEDKGLDMKSLMLNNNPHLLMRVLGILAKGFSITVPSDSKSQNIGPCPIDNKGISSHLVLRSLLGIMAAAAQEQIPFQDMLDSKTLTVPPNAMLEQDKPGTLPPEPLFTEAVPPIELIPLLRITGTANDSEGPPLIRLLYRGKIYQIADEKTSGLENSAQNQYWNRDVFRLVNQLTAQVTVDISKFPLPAILQLNTQ